MRFSTVLVVLAAAAAFTLPALVRAETAELPEEIDVARAQRAKQRAELRLSGKSPLSTPEDIDYTRAIAALARAVARLMTAGRLSQH